MRYSALHFHAYTYREWEHLSACSGVYQERLEMSHSEML